MIEYCIYYAQYCCCTSTYILILYQLYISLLYIFQIEHTWDFFRIQLHYQEYFRIFENIYSG